MVKKALAQLPQHATLVIYLNMESSADDFALLREQYGYQWLDCQNDGARQVITIKK